MARPNAEVPSRSCTGTEAASPVFCRVHQHKLVWPWPPAPAVGIASPAGAPDWMTNMLGGRRCAPEHRARRLPVPAVGCLIGDDGRVCRGSRADLLDDLGLAGQGRPQPAGWRTHAGHAPARRSHPSWYWLRGPHRGLCLGRDLRLLTLVAHPGHQAFCPDRIVFRLHCRLNWSLEARAVGDAAQLQAGDLQAEDAAERF